MAHTNRGTKVSAPDEQVPTGYTRPTITTVDDYMYKIRVVLSVLKSTVQNATKVTTMANIIGDAAIGVTKQVTDLMALDYISTRTVTFHSDIVAITDLNPPQASGNFFGSTANSYVVTVDVFIKTAA